MHENKEIVRMLLNFFSLDGGFLESSESFDAKYLSIMSSHILFFHGRNITRYIEHIICYT